MKLYRVAYQNPKSGHQATPLPLPPDHPLTAPFRPRDRLWTRLPLARRSPAARAGGPCSDFACSRQRGVLNLEADRLSHARRDRLLRVGQRYLSSCELRLGRCADVIDGYETEGDALVTE